MRHFVNEEALDPHGSLGEIVTIGVPFGMKMHMPQRSHGDIAGLEWEPFAPPQCDQFIVYRLAEYTMRQFYFASGQAALPTSGA